jgi:hypothetical protein
VLHDEIHRVAGLATPEAFVDIPCRVDAERRRTLVVERATSKIVDTPPFERYKFANYINDAGCVKNPVDRGSVYHSNGITNKWVSCFATG